MRKKAFTLIELLVVIAITGILATVILVSYGNSQARARDSKRIGDLNAISSAVKLYYDENKFYPRADQSDPLAPDPCVSRVKSSNEPRWSGELVRRLGAYITTPVVKDPLNAVRGEYEVHNVPIWQEETQDAYYYTLLSTRFSYVLAARMENFDRGNYVDLGKNYVSPPPSVSVTNCLGSPEGDGTQISVENESFTTDKVVSHDTIGYYFIGANLK